MGFLGEEGNICECLVGGEGKRLHASLRGGGELGDDCGVLVVEGVCRVLVVEGVCGV